jgi:prepilin-type N-terminal cleavage/methylation domain-containing protein
MNSITIKYRKEEGLSLTELMVVLVIIGVLV